MTGLFAHLPFLFSLRAGGRGSPQAVGAGAPGEPSSAAAPEAAGESTAAGGAVPTDSLWSPPTGQPGDGGDAYGDVVAVPVLHAADYYVLSGGRSPGKSLGITG